MKRLVIEIREPGDRELPGPFDMVDELGRRADGLNFDELLGQVVSMVHPNLGHAQYAMRTPEEWAELRGRRRKKPDVTVEVFCDIPF